LWDLHVVNKQPIEYRAPLIAALQEYLFSGRTSGTYERYPLDELCDTMYRRAQKEADQGQIILAMLQEAIAELLYVRSVTAGATGAYREFARQLEDDDVVLSFNWDNALEVALTLEGKRWSQRINQIAETDIASIIKLHGSIDYWIVDRPVDDTALPEILDDLALEAPSLVTPDGVVHGYVLTRIKTHDLGARVITRREQALRDGVPATRLVISLETENWSFVPNDRDIGPFMLRYVLPRYPSPFMLMPASPAVLYDWHYEAIKSAMRRRAYPFRSSYIVGYSFPHYDERALHLLTDITKPLCCSDVHIVNPSVSAISAQTLEAVFGTWQAHACGFEQFDWNRDQSCT